MKYKDKSDVLMNDDKVEVKYKEKQKIILNDAGCEIKVDGSVRINDHLEVK
jgi:hypothetical protein